MELPADEPSEAPPANPDASLLGEDGSEEEGPQFATYLSTVAGTEETALLPQTKEIIDGEAILAYYVDEETGVMFVRTDPELTEEEQAEIAAL